MTTHKVTCACGEVHDAVTIDDDGETSEELRARVIDAIPARVTLAWCDYRDTLNVSQVVELYAGKGYEYEVPRLDEWTSEATWNGACDAADDLRAELGVSECAFADIRDEVIETMLERDDSDLAGDVIRQTGSMWHRYTLEHDVEASSEDGTLTVADVWGALGCEGDPTDAQHDAILSIIGNAWECYTVGVVFQAPVADVAECLRRIDGGEEIRATWEDANVLVWCPMSGRGWAESVPDMTVSTTLDPAMLRLDEPNTSEGYTFTGDVCGGWWKDDSTTTFNVGGETIG